MRMQVRRPLSLLLVLALVLSLSVSAFAAGTTNLSLASGADSSQVLVNADSADVVADGKVLVTYDAEVLHFEGAEVGSAWPEGSDVSLQVNAFSTGKVLVAFAGVYEAAQGDVIKLNFTPVKEGTTTVTLKDVYCGGTSELELTAGCPSSRFDDVNPDAWYHEGIDYVITKGYMNGVSDTNFDPYGTTTRAMLVTVLYRMEGKPSVDGLTVPFTDVPQGWYKDAVAWAYNNGIVQGISADQFGPSGTLTRAQTAAFLYRYAALKGADMEVKGDLSAYVDNAEVSAWAVEALSWAVGVGLLGSLTSDVLTLSPNSPATRAQIAKILRDFDLKVLG